MVMVYQVEIIKDFLVGLLFLRTISLLLGEESIKQYTLYSPNDVANLNIFYRKKVGALGQFFTDLYLPVAVFLAVSLEDQGIKIIYIKSYSGSLDLIIMAFIITALVGVSVK